jgi:hypothetical protein
VELRGFEPLTYSMRTSRSGRLQAQAVLARRETAAQSVDSVGRRKLLKILLRTRCVPAAMQAMHSNRPARADRGS